MGRLRKTGPAEVLLGWRPEKKKGGERWAERGERSWAGLLDRFGSGPGFAPRRRKIVFRNYFTWEYKSRKF